MAWTIKFSPKGRRQLAKLDKEAAKRIRGYLKDRISILERPRELGAPLSGSLEGYWRYRVGDYRVICDIRDAELVILTISIGHRKEVYQ